jgi:pimeloyl-ACP methyl ester carboxylesterase
MQIVERGQGEPLVLVTGLQGRWEYMQAAVEALAKHFRVITFPLCDEPSAQCPFDPARPIESYVSQIESALDQTSVSRATICGISFGGVIALRFAAARPERVRSLVLASTPGPGWHLKRRHELYARFPRIFGPVFAAESPFRLRAEICAALPERASRAAFRRRLLETLLRAPLSLRRMAARARLISHFDTCGDCARVSVPTLIVTGEPGLDHVVPVDGSSDYARRISGAKVAVIERSGHLGAITQAEAFAGSVHRFVMEQRHAAA